MKIFLAEDERILRVSLADELRDAGYQVFEFAEASGVLQKIADENPDLLITDIRMPGIDGLELLEKVKKLSPDTFVVVMTAYASVDTAIKALKLGAYDYLSKPFRNEEILHLTKRVAELRDIKQDNLRLQTQISEKFDFSSFAGESDSVKKIFELVQSVAHSNASVLITGETGTGKEMLANIIHYNSNRSNKPFVKVSCAILAREVFESELFGHEKGAFTGAEKSRKGRFEIADKGTIYLDDIDDVPLELQVKLLRVLQEQEVEPVGATKAVKIDVRVVSSTKYDLKKLISQGKFRDDLFYRLNVIPIHIPPLRERKDDIRVLVNRFLTEFSQGKPLQINPDALGILENYKWPGNVRELRNLMERLVLTTTGNQITVTDIPSEFIKPEISDNNLEVNDQWNLEEILAATEVKLIKAAMVKSGGNKTKAARLLNIPLSTFRTKAEKYSLDF
ncbi:MAG: sigma-54-dependent Fis family transcriptional regulator [Bacteroidetes bacterium]|nr:MAG: sigma-54-dependent Fis family transcriptional regulator [Bacteroidota bacterium]